MVNDFAGTGEWIGPNKERVNFDKNYRGQYVNPVTGKAVDTTVGIIHYSKMEPYCPCSTIELKIGGVICFFSEEESGSRMENLFLAIAGNKHEIYSLTFSNGDIIDVKVETCYGNR